ncbi:hypothetical protein ACFLSJ_07690 [Verrucomicrobiota bacterium]
MDKRVLRGPGKREKLPDILEGYLFGLGEVCHGLFGGKGEEAMYVAVGRFFIEYLKKMGITVEEPDPWERYCHLIEVFTEHGFYGYVELEQRGDNVYWMLETDQYAGRVWEEQGTWERGCAPCPLWAAILASLGDIGQTIILDEVSFVPESNGFKSTFHFESTDIPSEDIIALTRRKLLSSMITFCARCRKVRSEDGKWISADLFLLNEHDAQVSHGYCPDCYEKTMSEVKSGPEGGENS